MGGSEGGISDNKNLIKPPDLITHCFDKLINQEIIINVRPYCYSNVYALDGKWWWEFQFGQDPLQIW